MGLGGKSLPFTLVWSSSFHFYGWVRCQIGVHGLVIDFADSKGEKYSATFLPEIAAENGWDRKETIESLIEKSGFTERITPTLLSDIAVRHSSSSHRHQAILISDTIRSRAIKARNAH